MFSERIKSLRQSLGLNQVEFGKKIGVTKQSVCNWENSNILPSIEMLVRIAETFSVSTDYILGLEKRTVVDVSGLNELQIAHIQAIIDDIRN